MRKANSEHRLVLYEREGYTEQDYQEYLGSHRKTSNDIWEELWEIEKSIFIGFLKCILFFIREYPKALEEVREEERARQKK
jgi:hypothetical protein